MTHEIDRHFRKNVKVSSQIIRNINNTSKLYVLYSGRGSFYIFFFVCVEGGGVGVRGWGKENG